MGFAVSWTGLDVYYVSLKDDNESRDDTLAPPTQDESISLEERLSIFSQVIEGSATSVALDWRK